MRHERLGQRKRAEMVSRKRHVPAQCILGWAHLHDACVIYEAGDRQAQGCDLPGRIAHTGYIRVGRLNERPLLSLTMRLGWEGSPAMNGYHIVSFRGDWATDYSAGMLRRPDFGARL
jgi:hypothetical protein